MSGAVLGWVLLLLQAPDGLKVDGVGAPFPVTGVMKADLQATNRMNQPQPAVRFQIQLSTDPTLVAGSLSNVTHWRGFPEQGATSATPLVNPSRVGNLNYSIVSFFPFAITLNDFGYEPVSVPRDVVGPEIPYGWGGGSILNPLSWGGGPYHWQIRYTRFNSPGNPVNSPWSALGSFTMGLPWSVASANGNGDPFAASWRFIALPIMPGTTVPASELLDDVSILYRLDEPSRSWIQITSPTELLEGGRGYAVHCAPGVVIDLSQGTVSHGDFTRNIPYTFLPGPVGLETVANEYVGNELVGNPYNTSIDWDWAIDLDLSWLITPGQFRNRLGDVHNWGGTTLNPSVSTSYYKWDGAQYLVYNGVSHLGGAGPTIAPFQGFGVVALQPGAVLRLRQPAPKAGVGKVRAAKSADGPVDDPNRWGLALTVQSGAALDTENVVGLDFEANDLWDLRDSEEPGTLNPTWVLLSMDHKDWTELPRVYTHDFRKTPPDAGDEVVWTLVLDGNTGLPATISWPAVSSTDWTFTFEDPAAPAVVDMSTTTSYVTPAVSGKSTYLVRAARLTSFKGALEVSAPGGPAAASVAAGSAGVPMLDVEIKAVDEPVTVRAFSVTHAGTGDPAHAKVSLVRDGTVLAGPTAFSGGAVSWVLSEQVLLGQTQLWRVVYDFDAAARGTYQAVVSADQAEGLGLYSSKSLVPASAALTGAWMTVTAPSSSGSGSGNGSCGLLGLDVLLLLALLRRRRAS